MKKLLFSLAVLSAVAVTAQVGINTETPSATLNVKTKDDAKSPKNLELENQAGAKLVTVFNNGKVGIGTTNIAPVSTLFVRGETGIITKDGWAVFSAVGDNHILFAGTHYRGDVEHFIEQWATKGIKDQSRMEYSKKGDKFVSFLGYDYKGVYDNPALNVYDGSGGMHIYADGDHSFDSKPSRIDFITTPANGIHSRTRMTINNAGNVGIGDVGVPTNILHVKADADPLKLEGLQAGTGEALVVGTDGVVKKEAINGIQNQADMSCTADNAGKINYTNKNGTGQFYFCVQSGTEYIWLSIDANSNGIQIHRRTGNVGGVVGD
ncbi:Uncharacterised protein [Candidatus Ornithobacterium hominis]|uniref:Uncharacterized protein n=1 Tax=Candidatus Ornithobacterium hominis TaxID=2497989 RepID=A0A383U1T3_9FLAO|nr:hypothetical protein [Candidatus Ornithobacterium hominis]MCT7904973.1 hypothetical protein [Candidatus Ornithobacterium hominis]SZD73480.1 Uncharacterised protein [Candidatus Ornithobacterium hominis]